jgi:uncharacterized protein YndB with AHSA1/START domain
MGESLKVTRVFKAGVQAVYDAWTNPEVFPKWMGPGPVECVKFKSELVVGGQYEIHMQTDEGIKIAYGEYKVLDANETLAFTWGWKDQNWQDSLVTLSFSEVADGTELVLEHTNLPDVESAKHHELGWNGCLEKLDNLLNA